MAKIGILVASSGNNQKLASNLEKIAIENNCEVEIIDLVDLKLPLYNTIEEKENGVPQTAVDLAEKILSLKAFLIVAPEYNGVMPAVLNNAIAWTSRATKEWRDAFEKYHKIEVKNHRGETVGHTDFDFELNTHN